MVTVGIFAPCFVVQTPLSFCVYRTFSDQEKNRCIMEFCGGNGCDRFVGDDDGVGQRPRIPTRHHSPTVGVSRKGAVLQSKHTSGCCTIIWFLGSAHRASCGIDSLDPFILSYSEVESYYSHPSAGDTSPDATTDRTIGMATSFGFFTSDVCIPLAKKQMVSAIGVCVGRLEYKKSAILAGEPFGKHYPFAWGMGARPPLVFRMEVYMMYALVFLFLGSLSFGQLGAIPVASGITVYSHDLILVILVLYSLAHLPKKIPHFTLRIPIVTFFSVCVLSLLVNLTQFSPQEMITSALYALRWGVYASLYFIVIASPLKPITWLWGLYASGTAVAILGMTQYLLYPSLRNLIYLGWDPHLYRLFSTFLDPNFAAMAFVLTLILGQYLWFHAKNKIILAFTQFVALIALFLTYSRSGYLAFVVALCMVCVFYKKIWVAFVGIILFGCVLFVLPTPGGEGVRLLRTVSTYARVENWKRGMQLIGERPVLGYGFNTLRFVQRAHGWTNDSVIVSKASAGIDNSLQFVWATTGIVGFGVYLLWLIVSMLLLGKHTLVFSSIISLLVHSQFSNSLFYPFLMLWMWILLGTVERQASSGR